MRRNDGSAEPGYDALVARLDGDVQLLADISRLFIDDAAAHLARIRSAIDANDPEALRVASHTLKGAAASFDAHEVVGAARALEEAGRQADPTTAQQTWHQLGTAMDDLLVTLRAYASTQRV